jgi:hypothetical protein
MLITAATALPLVLSPVAVEAPSESLSYVSDFIVFAGADETGKVLFAFDANRGSEGESAQAEHFQRLWVEGQGWSTLPGEGDLEVEEMWSLPSSDAWKLSGSAAEGLGYRCEQAKLTLEVEPLEDRTWRELDGDIFATGTAAATLTLDERVVRGHVHHEYCYLSTRNPLAKTYTDLFGDGFHGVYALVGEGENLRPFKYHRTGGTLRGLLKRSDGFGPASGDPGWQRLPDTGFDATDWDLAGFFSWPGRYEVDWTEGEGDAAVKRSFDVRLRQREVVANYVIAGLAVNVLEGTVNLNGTPEPLFGMALVVR